MTCNLRCEPVGQCCPHEILKSGLRLGWQEQCLSVYENPEILKSPMQWEDGYVIPSDKPGLGVELDEVVAEANPYTGKALHLDMHPAPV